MRAPRGAKASCTWRVLSRRVTASYTYRGGPNAAARSEPLHRPHRPPAWYRESMRRCLLQCPAQRFLCEGECHVLRSSLSLLVHCVATPIHQMVNIGNECNDYLTLILVAAYRNLLTGNLKSHT